VDDDIAEGNHNGTISHSAMSNDTNYNGIGIKNVSVTITDNDGAGVSLTPSSVTATEGGATGSYTVVVSVCAKALPARAECESPPRSC
jgi:hypothetical protein